MTLVRVEEELDVSGGTPLDKRDGLRAALEAVEAGEADVIVAAYFDRLVRSLRVQGEVVQRVERAGGSVLALDVGEVTEGTAGQWLSGTMLGAVAEYQRRTTAERSREAQRRAVARGVPPLANIPPGYRRGPDGRLVVEPREAPIVAEAFGMRANGAPIKQVRAYLCEHGIARTFRSTQSMLASRVVLGEINFGKMVNPSAHQPIVDAETFRRVQATVIPRGRRPISDLLLARQGVLRCGTCGGRLMAGSRTDHSDKAKRYPMYRCAPTSDCPRRVAISADLAEGVVVGHVRAALAGIEGEASADGHLLDAERQLDTAQQSLDTAILTLADMGGEAATREALDRLRQARDDAQAALDAAGGRKAAVTLSAEGDWDSLSLDERRQLVRATIASAIVAPGKPGGRHTNSAARVSVELVGK